MQNRQFDSLVFSRALAEANEPALAFEAKDVEEAEVWQRKLRRKVGQLVGGFPRERCPLHAEVIERKEFPTYVRETVVFQSREHLSVFGYFLVPKEFTYPGRAMICLPGHGRGCDDIVGVVEDGTMRSGYGGYCN